VLVAVEVFQAHRVNLQEKCDYPEFWAMDEVICSIDALVCSTPAACSLADCDSDCAVALTASDALARACAPLFKHGHRS
jgi:hypothetical protein